jgi:hypothetical protein
MSPAAIYRRLSLAAKAAGHANFLIRVAGGTYDLVEPNRIHFAMAHEARSGLACAPFFHGLLQKYPNL